MSYTRSKIRRPHRNQSPLDALPTAQLKQLKRWLIKEDVSYNEAQARLKARFNVRASKTAIWGFWHRVCSPIVFGLESQTPVEAMTVQIVLRHGGRIIGNQVVEIKATRGGKLFKSQQGSKQ